MTTTVKLFADKMGGTDSASFIGSKGDVFLDLNSTTIRVSNGLTPGGHSIGIEEHDPQLVASRLESYELAVKGWRESMAMEVQHPGHTFLQWQVDGENADEYRALMQLAWQIQNNPSSPPSSPPTPVTLMFYPAIPASYYNQIIAQLAFIKGQYDLYLEAISAKKIAGSSIVVPSVIKGELEEDVTIRVTYSTPVSGGNHIVTNRDYRFSTNGRLMMPDGGYAVSTEQLMLALASSTDFTSFKNIVMGWTV